MHVVSFTSIYQGLLKDEFSEVLCFERKWKNIYLKKMEEHHVMAASLRKHKRKGTVNANYITTNFTFIVF